MAEYIKLEDALMVCEKEYQEQIKMQNWAGDTVAWNIGHAIKGLETIKMEPEKKGKWMERNGTWFCSRCNFIGRPEWKGCPICLAKMEG